MELKFHGHGRCRHRESQEYSDENLPVLAQFSLLRQECCPLWIPSHPKLDPICPLITPRLTSLRYDFPMNIPLGNNVTVPLNQFRTVMLFAPLSADNKAPYSSFPRTTTNFDDYDIKIKHFVNLKYGHLKYGHSKTERRHGETIATDG